MQALISRLSSSRLSPPPPSTCTACDTTFQPALWPSSKDNTACSHASQACLSCWQSWLSAQITTKAPSAIRCISCPNTLTQLEIKHLADLETFDAYLAAELKAALSLDLEFRWCISPSCEHGQVHSEGYIFTCAACGMRACTSCESEWHGGVTCGAYQESKREVPRRRKEEEELSKKFVKEVSKVCPGPGCERNVEKVSGCDHMRCTMCKFEFCWECLASYVSIRSVGNAAHVKNCSHYRATVPAAA